MTQSEQAIPGTPAHRLHRVSPLFLVWGAIKAITLPLLASLTTGTIDFQTAILGAVLLASLFSIIQYRFYRYWLEPGEIIVKKGVLFRSVRHIPCERIQNIQVTQGPLHRLLGVAQLQLESASGNRPEAVICVISSQAVEAVRNHVHQADSNQPQAVESATEAETSPPLLQLDFRDILRCGLLQWRGPVLIGAMLAAVLQNNPSAIGFYSELFRLLENYLNVSSTSLWILHLIGGSLAGLIVVWLASTLMALLKYHGFTLRFSNHKLTVRAGLLTRIQASLPTRRIQLLRVRESPLHRWMKRISIAVENAGGSQQESQSAIRLLAPVLPAKDKQPFLSQIQGDVSWQQIHWQPVEFRAWRRVAFKLAIGLLIVQAGLLIWLQHPLAWLVLLLAAPLYRYAIRSVQCRGYYLDNDVIGSRRGVWFKTETFVRLSKIQAVTVSQTPFDRRYRMARLAVDTAGAMYATRGLGIPFLDQQLAVELEQRMAQQVSTTEFVW